MKLIKVLPFIMVTALPFYAVADEKKQECTDYEVDTISVYTMTRVNLDEDISQVYQNKIEEITQFAKKHKLEKFKILSQDASVSQSCCGTFEQEVSVSATFQFLPDYSVLNKAYKEFKAPSISTYRSITSECKDK